MKFLVDNALPPKLAAELSAAGHDAVHVLDLGLAESSDPDIMKVARSQGRIIISADSDFSRILALEGRHTPSLLFLRGELPRRASLLAGVVIARLPTCGTWLESGAVVTMTPTRTRIRELPIRNN